VDILIIYLVNQYQVDLILGKEYLILFLGKQGNPANLVKKKKFKK